MTQPCAFAADFRDMCARCNTLASRAHDAGNDSVYCPGCKHMLRRGTDGIWAVVKPEAAA